MSQIRISDKLEKEAKKAINRSRRSLPQQVEYWSELGRAVEKFMTGDQVSDALSGRVKLRIETERPFTAQDIQNLVAADTRPVNERIGADEWYIGSKNFPGFIEKHNMNGEVIVGSWTDGKFVPRGKPSKAI